MQKASLTLRVTIEIAAYCFVQTTYEFYYVKSGTVQPRTKN